MQSINKMRRQDVIFDLARYSHPDWYHSLLSWDTPWLKALLMYFREQRKTIKRIG
jgi:hypothetical protein